MRTLLATCLALVPVTASTASTITIVLPGESIQMAIDEASNGDVIQLVGGDYFLRHPLSTLGKDIVIRGSAPPANVTRPTATWPNTSIHATGPWPVIHCAGGGTPTFQYLHVTNGQSFLDNGGGLECDGSSPTFIGCKFDHNEASGQGGAIAALNGSFVTVQDSLIKSNRAVLGGGAVYADETSATQLSDTLVCGNRFMVQSCVDSDLLQLKGSVKTSNVLVNCTTCAQGALGDLNHDGVVDGNDLASVLGAWGGALPESDPACGCMLQVCGGGYILGPWGVNETQCEQYAAQNGYCGYSCMPGSEGDLAGGSSKDAQAAVYGCCCFDDGPAIGTGVYHQHGTFTTQAECTNQQGAFTPNTLCSFACPTETVVLCCTCAGGPRYLPQQRCNDDCRYGGPTGDENPGCWDPGTTRCTVPGQPCP